jgi:hypothetical protein
MPKKDDLRRSQKEFLFVFKGSSHTPMQSHPFPNVKTDSAEKRLSDDEAQAHRKRLIANLREFGC